MLKSVLGTSHKVKMQLRSETQPDSVMCLFLTLVLMLSSDVHWKLSGELSVLKVNFDKSRAQYVKIGHKNIVLTAILQVSGQTKTLFTHVVVWAVSRCLTLPPSQGVSRQKF